MAFLYYLLSPLNRYFSRVFTLWFFSCSAIVIAVISLFEATEQARRAMGNAAVQFQDILEIICLKIPNHIQMLLPFIVLTASLITLSRLNHSQEIVAAKSVGVSVWQFIGGISALVGLIAILQLAIINPMSAVLNARLLNLENKMSAGNGAALSISETGMWIREVYDQRESIINIKHINLQTKELRHITFQNFAPSGHYVGRIDAESATLDRGFWHLKNVKKWTGRDSGFPHQELVIPSHLSLNKILESNTPPESLSFWQLRPYIQILERSGLSTLPYRLYWHSLIAKVGMMLVMVFLAAAFSLRPIRQGYTTSLIALGVSSGFFLHFMNDIVYALGLADKLPLILSAWSPTLIIGAFSITLLIHLEDG